LILLHGFKHIHRTGFASCLSRDSGALLGHPQIRTVYRKRGPAYEQNGKGSHQKNDRLSGFTG
jgi:hypothetical protein